MASIRPSHSELFTETAESSAEVRLLAGIATAAVTVEDTEARAEFNLSTRLSMSVGLMTAASCTCGTDTAGGSDMGRVGACRAEGPAISGARVMAAAVTAVPAVQCGRVEISMDGGQLPVPVVSDLPMRIVASPEVGDGR